MRLASGLGVGTALIYLAFLPPAIHSIDGHSMLAVAESLVTRLDFSVPAELGRPGMGNRYYSPWSPLLSVIVTPFVAAGLRLAPLVNLPGHYVAAVFALMLQALLTGATAALIALLAVRLGSDKENACLAALGYAFGTMAMAYARTFYAEPLLALLTLASVYFVIGTTRTELVCCGTAAGLCVLAKAPGVIVGPVLALHVLLKDRSFRRATAPLLGTTAGVFLYLVYNHLRFGNPLSSGMPWLFKTSVFVEGFLGHLISPGQGLLFYCPPVVLAIVGMHRGGTAKARESRLIAAVFAAYLILYSFWHTWEGYSWTWGPRYLLPSLPGLMVLAALSGARWRRGFVLLVLVGFLGNSPTLVSPYERYYAEAKQQGVSVGASLWSPAQSPLANGWSVAARQVRDAWASDVTELVRRAGPPDELADAEMFRIITVWWWMLPAVGVPRWIGVVCAGGMITIGLMVIQRALAASSRPFVCTPPGV